MPSPDSVRIAIQAVHQAMLDHQDPAQIQALSQCLSILTKVQASDAQQDQGGGGGGPPQQGPPQGPQAQALLARLAG